MKLVVVSDPHLDWKTHGRARFDEVADVLVAAANVAIKERAVFVCLGDLMDPDSGSCVFRCMRFLLDLAARMGGHNTYSLWIAGNHDVIEDGRGRSTLEPLNAITHARVFEKPSGYDFAMCDEPDIAFLALPFTASSHDYDPNEVARAIIPEKKYARTLIVAGHMTQIDDAEEGEETKEMPRGRVMRFPLEVVRELRPDAVMLNGHFHKRQRKHGIEIPGSLAVLTHGEEHHKPRFLLLDIK